MTDTLSHGDRRKQAILEAGLILWRDDPASCSARAIGRALDMTHAAVLYHYGTAQALRQAVACEAVRLRDPVIVPMLIACRHTAVADMSETERRSYMRDC